MNKNSEWTTRKDIPITILAWMGVIVVVFWLLSHVSKSLLLLIIAALIAYALSPLVKWLDRYLPKSIAIIFVYMGVLLAVSITIFFVINTAINQFASLIHYVQSGMNVSDDISTIIPFRKFGISEDQMTKLGQELTYQAEKFTTSIFPVLGSIFNFILDTLVVSILSIYILIDGGRVANWLRTNLPVEQRKRVRFALHTLERVVGGYIRGQILLSVIIGLLVGVGMSILHIPYALLLGVLAFILEFIPILGTLISGAICLLLAISQGWIAVLLVLAYFIFAHIIEGDILGPRIVGKAIGLHPVVSIVALIAGTELFGVVGALFASPVAGIIQAFLVAFWLEWRETHKNKFEEQK